MQMPMEMEMESWRDGFGQSGIVWLIPGPWVPQALAIGDPAQRQRVEHSNWISTLSAPSHGPLADTKLIGLIYVNFYKKMHSGCVQCWFTFIFALPTRLKYPSSSSNGCLVPGPAVKPPSRWAPSWSATATATAMRTPADLCVKRLCHWPAQSAPVWWITNRQRMKEAT